MHVLEGSMNVPMLLNLDEMEGDILQLVNFSPGLMKRRKVFSGCT